MDLSWMSPHLNSPSWRSSDEAFGVDDDHPRQQQVNGENCTDPNPVAAATATDPPIMDDLPTQSSTTAYAAPPQSAAPAAAVAPSSDSNHQNQSHRFLDDIIVGYAFGPKKMETMGLIMAEASKALNTVECSTTGSTSIPQLQQQQLQQQQQQLVLLDEASMATSVTSHSHCHFLTSSQASRTTTAATSRYFSDDDDDDEEDTRSWSSTRSSQHHLRVMGRGGGGGSSSSSSGGIASSTHGGKIQLTFMTDENGAIHLVRTGSNSGVGKIDRCGGTTLTTTSTTATTMGDEGSSITGTSAANKMGTSISSSASCSSTILPSLSPCKEIMREGINSGGADNITRRQHPIRVSFVPIDLEIPLEEQHGGKFDVILHKLTEDILCMSKMLRDKDFHDAEEEDEDLDEQCTDVVLDYNDGEKSNLLEFASPSTRMVMSRRQARASIRIQRLRDYKQNIHPSCVLVDSPNNILAVMSRAEMAEVLSRCLAGVTTRGGIPVRTPRFLVVEEYDEDQAMIEWDMLLATSTMANTTVDDNTVQHSSKFSRHTRPALADEIDSSGFEYPLIAKPLTAAGTKSSHHMGIVLARDGLQRLKTPCLLQEFANHGEKLFKVYVLGESVWVFARESLPNLPLGEKCDVSSLRGVHPVKGAVDGQRCPVRSQTRESYVEFERPAGSNCYVEFNSQRPYPKLSDFGIVSNTTNDDKPSVGSLITKRQRQDEYLVKSCRDDDHGHYRLSPTTNKLNADSRMIHRDSVDLARFVTNEELEPVTNAIRDAFGLKLFGFDVIVKHDPHNSVVGGGSEGREILVVDVNYFPGYKEVPNFPSLLAQYLTRKAVESRVQNFDGS